MSLGMVSRLLFAIDEWLSPWSPLHSRPPWGWNEKVSDWLDTALTLKLTQMVGPSRAQRFISMGIEPYYWDYHDVKGRNSYSCRALAGRDMDVLFL